MFLFVFMLVVAVRSGGLRAIPDSSPSNMDKISTTCAGSCEAWCNLAFPGFSLSSLKAVEEITPRVGGSIFLEVADVLGNASSAPYVAPPAVKLSIGDCKCEVPSTFLPRPVCSNAHDPSATAMDSAKNKYCCANICHEPNCPGVPTNCPDGEKKLSRRGAKGCPGCVQCFPAPSPADAILFYEPEGGFQKTGAVLPVGVDHKTLHQQSLAKGEHTIGTYVYGKGTRLGPRSGGAGPASAAVLLLEETVHEGMAEGAANATESNVIFAEGADKKPTDLVQTNMPKDDGGKPAYTKKDMRHPKIDEADKQYPLKNNVDHYTGMSRWP